ncbi:dTMP kinase [Usitatibacter palustris]|uniref:Thymidylate kinase n=1 Tax=Usitatibacter palustris TaxID=2732487 RepID=A0A6M4H900_9PROT|nr:dTMP kinase [Usitatibacter palustris]QJR15203.1 Thymidylate kinase [Usitatibacter palustris]
MRGKFITVEGIDGAGKSSHLAQLGLMVRKGGFEEVVTREPGGTPLGEKLREIVLDVAMDPRTEALMMFAARREHVVRVIEPALAAGRWVISDRFSDASYAYQCGGRGLPKEVFAALETVVHPGLQPDATFLFDLDPAVAAQRSLARNGAPDKFEREQAAFVQRVREAYLERARASSGRIHVIDAAGTLEEVRERVVVAFSRAFA